MEKSRPATLLTHPPIEAVANGALSLTPGVKISDVLKRGASLRCWDKKGEKHIWHPLFVAGQPWPTIKGLELILSASTKNQKEIDLMIGEPQSEGNFEVIYIEGIPTIQKVLSERKFKIWSEKYNSFVLNPPGQTGEDCLKLIFNIDSESYLKVQGIDLRTGTKMPEKVLGLIN